MHVDQPGSLRTLLNGSGDVTIRWINAPMSARRDIVRALAGITVRRLTSQGGTASIRRSA